MLAQARFLIDMNNLLDIRDRVIVASGSTSGLGRAIALGLGHLVYHRCPRCGGRL